MGPPAHHGNRSRSSQVNRVRPRRARRMVKRPRPVTTPWWAMPITRPGRHSVTSMRSVIRSGPTLVSQSNVVPTPSRRSVRNRMATASRIHSGCEAMSRTTAHTRFGGTSITVVVLILVTGLDIKVSAVAVRGQQGRALTRYLRRQVRAYSRHYRPALDRAFRDGRSGIDLGALPITRWSDVTDPRPFVLHPDYGSITRHGEPRLAAKVLWARFTGGTIRLNRTYFDPTYKPIHWLMADGVPVGYSHADLERLAELGWHWLESAGVKGTAVIVSVVPPGPTLGYWELVHAARKARLSAVFLPPDAPISQIARLRPTVLAGRPEDLERVVSGPPEDLSQVRIVLAVDAPLSPDQRQRIEAGLAAPDAVVLSAWAPHGVRSLWTECRGRRGLHTSPAAEYLETVDDEIIWTAIGWSGSVFVRLATGVTGALVRGTCEGCGQSTPRVVVRGVEPARAPARPSVDIELDDPDEVEEEVVVEMDEVDEPDEVFAPEPEPAAATPAGNGAPPAFAALLDGHPGVAVWQAELRTVDDAEELFVFFSAGPNGPVPVLADLAEAVPVTQFVVLSEEELLDRLARHDDRQVVDLR